MSLFLPWRAKLHLKLLLSRLPLPYRFWKGIHLFQHGRMERGGYALGVFRRHLLAGAPPRPFTTLELGPGDALATALIAKAHGAERTWLVDTGAYATRDPGVYLRLAELLRGQGLPVPSGWSSCEGMLDACGARYLTGGLNSLAAIPSASVDFIWSQAVLEHVRRHEFAQTLGEFRRCLSARGRMTHQVDLADHLGGALNHLRFPAGQWESPRWVKAGFYTNRLRLSHILDLVKAEGFRIDDLEVDQWDRLPTPLAALDPAFRELDEGELRTRSFFMVCSPARP
jgi:hypothetical protein